MIGNDGGRVPVLLLISDTGGGHRSAAVAVSQALECAYPGRFDPVIHDPLRDPGAPARLRWIPALYGPSIRLTPWIWSLIYHSSNSRRAFSGYERALFGPVNGMVASAVARRRPAVIVCFHAMTVRPAVRASRNMARAVPVVTVITDLVIPHFAWQCTEVDRIVVPSAAMRASCERRGIAGNLLIDLGLPVSAAFSVGPLQPADRRALRQSLGLSQRRFLVVVVGGAEGSGDLVRRTTAMLRRLGDVEVVALCGRNRAAKRRLTRLAAKSGGRLIVNGFVDNMADWLRSADVVVTKAGPGMIAEASCCGAPMIITSHVPGNEWGNADYVAAAGAGCHAPTVRQLITRIEELRADPVALDAMRTASASLARPSAAPDVAALVAGLAAVAPSMPEGGGAPELASGVAQDRTRRGAPLSGRSARR
jgi:1,2-diacylglycerol 3-beta-galactosyltransferase